MFKCGLEEWDVFPELLALKEPVGVFVPDKIIEQVTSFGEAITVKQFLYFPAGLIDLMANPVFAIVFEFGLGFFGGVVIDELLDEARDVPEFIAEIAAGDNFARAEGLIDAGGATSDETEPEGV